MKLLKIPGLVFLILFISGNILAQNRRVADRYFEEYAYVKASTLYEAIYKKGDTSLYIVKRIADCYYNNVQTVKAEFWYNKLTKNYKDVEDDYLFKYAQTLRSNGKYRKSDSLLLILVPAKDAKEIREDLEEKKYLIDFSKDKNKRISFRNISLNTPYSDFGGFIHDNKAYFASSSPISLKKQKLYKWNNQPFLNIHYATSYVKPLEGSKKDSVLELDRNRILSNTINTQYHESTPIFSKDGKFMYFTRVNYDGKNLKKDKNQSVNLKLYRAEFSSNNWINVIELPFNSDEYSVGHPALSPDEKALYFVSDMPGGIGKTDLYKVNVDDHKNYSEPINLGETINTPGKEMFPFVGNDNTLYFSSNGHIGVGLLDVFQSKVYDNNTYDKPVNLGSPFNSKRDDFSFFIAEKGNKGFISSNRNGGKGDDDIYSFMIHNDPKKEKIKKIKPEKCTELITGVVKSTHDGRVIPYATVRLVNEKGELLEEVYTDKNGEYVFEDIDCEVKDYVLKGSKQDFKPDTNKAKTSGIKYNKAKADLFLTPLIIGNQIVISPIYFDYDKSTIRSDAQYELENIVTVMNNHPDMVIKIESHTDSRGSKNYNRSLSDRRAKSTRDYLYIRNIPKDKVESAIGYGEDNLLNHCDDENRNKCSEEEHQLNRRSYFYIVSGGNDVDIINKKPSHIDNSILKIKKKKLKSKLLIERLNNFRRSRAKKADDKCTRDTKC